MVGPRALRVGAAHVRRLACSACRPGQLLKDPNTTVLTTGVKGKFLQRMRKISLTCPLFNRSLLLTTKAGGRNLANSRTACHMSHQESLLVIKGTEDEDTSAAQPPQAPHTCGAAVRCQIVHNSLPNPRGAHLRRRRRAAGGARSRWRSRR